MQATMMMMSWWILFLSFVRSQHLDDLVKQLRHLESLVEFRGGSFQMGINDRNGVNMEYPVKQAHVDPFR